MKQHFPLAFTILLLLCNTLWAQNIEDTAHFKIVGIIHTDQLGILQSDEIRTHYKSENLKTIPSRNGEYRVWEDKQNTEDVIYRKFLTVDQQDLGRESMLNDDSLRQLIFDKKAYLSFYLATDLLNYIVALPQCDSTLAKRIQNTYDFSEFAFNGWRHSSIHPKKRIPHSESVSLNKKYSYVSYAESDFLIVETTYEQYLVSHPQYEFEGFVLSTWLHGDDDGDRPIRIAIPLND